MSIKFGILQMFFFFFVDSIYFSTQRQNSTSNTHEVPYARLIDSPNRKSGQPTNSSTPVTNESDMKLKTNRSIRMPTPKSSASESKLSVDYFQKSDISVGIFVYHFVSYNLNIHCVSFSELDSK